MQIIAGCFGSPVDVFKRHYIPVVASCILFYENAGVNNWIYVAGFLKV